MNPVEFFKNKWDKVRRIEEKEIGRMTISDKVRKIDSIMRLGFGLGASLDRKRNKDILDVQNIWVALKKHYPWKTVSLS